MPWEQTVIKIGDFARLGQVSVVTLRHYDEIGLLKPVSVDKFTGYRYYSISQLPRLNRILALKDLGFSLEQIEKALNGITLDELRGMLKLKQAEQEQHLAEEEARLKRIATRLRQIELEAKMSETKATVVLKTVPEMLLASCKVTIPSNDQVPEYLGMAYGALWDFVKANALTPQSPHLAIWHQAAEVVENEVAEAAVEIDRNIPGSDKVQVYTLPETQVVSYVHEGNFEDFQIGHPILLKWIEENGYRVAGAYREIYIRHDPNNLAETSTEIQYPVEKA
jgi:DNA-binding transcriptional MerR regulator